ncbi:MAG: hypothetical protein QF733_03605 [Phycisphaerales bacterium]|jgi:hypothetical protein|nr:hypothetical protein [Phycisphaerales bacterium]
MTDPEPRPQDEEPKRRHHVTMLQSIDRQVGEHVMAALHEEEAVAAITTLIPGVRHDRVVSLPLTKDQVEAIRDVLQQAEAEASDADDEEEGRREGFLGFHTVLKLEDEDEPVDTGGEGQVE